MATKYRVTKNNCLFECQQGYVWDLQRGYEIEGKTYWSPFLMFKDRAAAEDTCRALEAKAK